MKRLVLILAVLVVACGGPKEKPTRTSQALASATSASKAPQVRPSPTTTSTAAPTSTLVPTATTPATPTASPVPVTRATPISTSTPMPTPSPTQEGVTSEETSPGYYGVYFADADVSVRAQFGLPDDTKVIALVVLRDGPAYVAGLRPRVPVWAVNGRSINSARSAEEAIGPGYANQQIQVTAGTPHNPAAHHQYNIETGYAWSDTEAAYLWQAQQDALDHPSAVWDQWALAYMLTYDNLGLPAQLHSALAAIDRLRRLAPRFAAPLFLRSGIDYQNVDWSAEERDLRAALKLQPNYGDVYAALVDVDFNYARNEKAVADADKMGNLPTTPGWAAYGYYRAGFVAQYYLDDTKKALSDYNRAIEASPGYGSPRYERGMMRSQSGNTKGAIDDLTVAVTSGDLPDAQQTDALKELKRLLKQKGNSSTT